MLVFGQIFDFSSFFSLLLDISHFFTFFHAPYFGTLTNKRFRIISLGV